MGADPEPRSLADKLDHLFQTVHPPGRGEYTYEEVASGMAEAGGPSISGSYVWQLRKGQRDNPTRRNIEALATFFRVPPAYFFDDELARAIDEELSLLTAMRDVGVRRVAFRSNGLPSEDLDVVGRMIDQLRRARGLDATPEEGGTS